MYKDLEVEVGKMWRGRTKITPVVAGALGIIKKGLDKDLQLLPGHPSVTELQITLMSTAHTICKALE